MSTLRTALLLLPAPHLLLLLLLLLAVILYTAFAAAEPLSALDRSSSSRLVALAALHQHSQQQPLQSALAALAQHLSAPACAAPTQLSSHCRVAAVAQCQPSLTPSHHKQSQSCAAVLHAQQWPVQRQMAASSVADATDKGRVELKHSGVQVAGSLDVAACEGFVSAALGVCALGQQLHSRCEKQCGVSRQCVSAQLRCTSACAAVIKVDMTHICSACSHCRDARGCATLVPVAVL
eukprot:5467-Heterococcus_DN1.PRE.3